MNIEQAKNIPITKILEKLKCNPARKTGQQLMYFAPWRKEKTPSLHVHEKKNWWYDFGIGIGGDIIAFVQNYLKSNNELHTVSNALDWLRTAIPHDTSPINYSPIKNRHDYKLKIKSVRPVEHIALIRYLENRGINPESARIILREVRALNAETGKTFFALGMLNEEEGWEIRNPMIKSCVGRKAISFLRGANPKLNDIHVFEGSMDYLSLVSQNFNRLIDDDVIILNSTACLQQIVPYIKGYGYNIIYSWLDNDLAGNHATAAIKEFASTERGLTHKPMNEMYVPFKDVNAWHMERLGL